MTLIRWALRGWYWRHTEQAMRWLAARLPHRLIAWVLAHVAAATIRPDENVADARWVELVGRWDHRELQGRAAERHGRHA